MQKKYSARYMTELAILVAIILAMKLMGLSSIPVGPLNMTLNMVPIGIGAMLLGPMAGAILGGIYGLTSLYDAITGASVMTGTFFQLSPFATVILCVGCRILTGFLTGFIFNGVKKLDKSNTVCYFLGGLSAPLLNTITFMGFIVLVFYRSDYIQGRVATLGVQSAFMFVIVSVGVQGLIEALTGMIIGGGVAKGVAKALKRT